MPSYCRIAFGSIIRISMHVLVYVCVYVYICVRNAGLLPPCVWYAVLYVSSIHIRIRIRIIQVSSSPLALHVTGGKKKKNYLLSQSERCSECTRLEGSWWCTNIQPTLYQYTTHSVPIYNPLCTNIQPTMYQYTTHSLQEQSHRKTARQLANRWSRVWATWYDDVT